MAQNYAASHLSALDERFSTESITDIIVNKGGIRVEFNGKNSVTIYNVDVVAETDYTRSGTNRFGSLIELGTGTQTFTLSQDKAFTFSVDRGNVEDSMHAQEVSKAVKRQVREVSVPTTDIYRLTVLYAYALANTQGAFGATASSNTTAYQNVLLENAALDDAEVPNEGRVLYVTPTFHNLLKRDPEFQKECDTSQKDLKKGIIGEVDGLTIVKAPASRFVTKFEFMIVWNQLLIAPTKFDSVRVLTEVQGIDGSVAEGRRYYDAFIPSKKGAAVRVRTKA